LEILRFKHRWEIQAVSCEMQTHFRSFPPERFTEKVLGAISRFMRPKAKLFAVKYRGILDVVHLQGLQKKFWAHGHDFCIQKRSCLP